MSNNEQQPLFEIEKHPTEAEIATRIEQVIHDAAQIRHAAEPKVSKAWNDLGGVLHLEEDDDGYRPPVRTQEAIDAQNAGNARRRTRWFKENKYTDAGSDLPRATDPYVKGGLDPASDNLVSAQEHLDTTKVEVSKVKRKLRTKRKERSYLSNREESSFMRGARELQESREARKLSAQQQGEAENASEWGC